MATDNFNRGSGSLGANWTQTPNEGAMDLVTDQVAPNTNADSGAYWNAVSFANNQYSQAVLVAVGATSVGTGAGVGVRHSTGGAETYYRVIASTAGTQINKVVAGSFSTIATDATAWANGDTIRLEISGNTLTVKRNGSTIAGLTTTDSSSPITSGSASMHHSSTSSGQPILDDWDGGDLAGGAASKSTGTMTLTGVQ